MVAGISHPPAAATTAASPGRRLAVRTLVTSTAEEAGRQAAALIAAQAQRDIATHGRFLLALSGGRTPAEMLRRLAQEPLPWERVHIFQTDERVAPRGSPERNLSLLEHALIRSTTIPASNLHAMPVEAASLPQAARDYAAELRALAGRPAVLDLVHLGLGADGHIASLFPGDAALDVTDADCVMTGMAHGQSRMTLTLPLMSRAARLLLLVTGESKAPALARLVRGDPTMPAGRLRRSRITIVADAAAAALADAPPGAGP